MELKEVRLYGHLGKKFGKSFKLAVSTPREAVHALSINIKGFKRYFKSFNYHIFVGKENIDINEVDNTSSASIIKIVPVTVGSGGFLKIVVGAALLWISGGTAGWQLSLGTSLVLSGISEVLFSAPKPKSGVSRDRPENTPSYIFNGVVNTVAQGNPVPLAYGRIRIGSQVISGGLTSRNIPI